MARTIGSIAVSIVANVQKFVKGLKTARTELTAFQRATKSLETSLLALGAGFTTFGITSFLKDQIDTIDALGKTAEKLGLTTEALASLQLAARRTGVDIQKFNMGMQRLGRRVAEAANGTGEARDAIKELGLNASELVKLKLDEQFSMIAESMSMVTNDLDKLRLSQKLFDSEGVDLVRTLNLGADGLAKMAREAANLNKQFSAQQAKQAAKFNDELSRLKESFGGAAGQLTIELGPHVTQAIEDLREILANFGIGRSRFDLPEPVTTPSTPATQSARTRQLIKEARRRVGVAAGRFPDTTTGFGAGGLFSGGIPFAVSSTGQALRAAALRRLQLQRQIGLGAFGIGQQIGGLLGGLVPTRGGGAAPGGGFNEIALKGSQKAFQAIRRSQKQDERINFQKKQLSEAKKSNKFLQTISENLVNNLKEFTFAGD